MYVLLLFHVSLGWVGGIKFVYYYSSSLPALLLLPSLFFLLLFALVLLVLLLVLLLLHSLCLGSHRFRLLSFARSLLSSPIVSFPPFSSPNGVLATRGFLTVPSFFPPSRSREAHTVSVCPRTPQFIQVLH